ncbi:MAG: peptidoglycan DD-metalloendopeptidase family protein [Gemmatimonadales bacterium]
MIDTAKQAVSGTGFDTVAFTPSDIPAAIPPSAVAPSPVPVSGAPTVLGSSFPAVTAADLSDLRSHSLVIPVEGVTADKLVDSFDDLRGGTRRHEAIDIMSPRGTRVWSADAGRVLKLHNSVAGGLSIYVADPTQRFIMLYAHLDHYRLGLAEGTMVKKGELLGFVGSTGNASPSAPHLHFAIARSDNQKEWWKGTPLNPFLIYRGT